MDARNLIVIGEHWLGIGKIRSNILLLNRRKRNAQLLMMYLNAKVNNWAFLVRWITGYRVPTGSGKHGKWLKNSMHGKVIEFEK